MTTRNILRRQINSKSDQIISTNNMNSRFSLILIFNI